MLFAPKYHNLDLPVFDPETRPAIQSDMQHQAEEALSSARDNGSAAEATFIRAVGVHKPFLMSSNVNKLLQRTDEELETLAELCDALVVRHQWGMYELNEDNYNKYEPYLPGTIDRLALPNNHILAAEVKAVDKAGPLTAGDHGDEESYQSVSDGLNEYRMLRGIRLGDLAMRQFITVTDTDISAAADCDFAGAAEAGTDSQVWLTDIEPRLIHLV